MEIGNRGLESRSRQRQTVKVLRLAPAADQHQDLFLACQLQKGAKTTLNWMRERLSVDNDFRLDGRHLRRARKLPFLAHRRMPDRKPDWELSLPVVFGLADDKGFPYRGKVVLRRRRDIDPKTHAQRWQAVVPNKDGIFMPGMSVRVRLITSEPHKVMLVDRNRFDSQSIPPYNARRVDAESSV